MTWEVTYYRNDKKQQVFVVYKPEQVEDLRNTKPEWASIEVRAMSREELARPDDGKDDSI
jgi:hypothetical protein